LVNCYDQAGIVIIALGLGPNVKAEWMFMNPFGFIFPTNLVGYPNTKCNNPFGKTEGHLLVANNAVDRWPFKNHAFVRVDGKIADACAGPVKATDADTLENYIANGIQGLAEKGYEDPTGKTTYAYYHAAEYHQRPGTVEDAGPHLGVSALDECDILDSKHDRKKSDNSRAAMAIAAATNLDATTYAVPVDALHDIIQDAALVKKINVDVSVNTEGLEATWDVPTPGQNDTEISIYFCRDNGRATAMFEKNLHLNSMPYASELEKPADPNVYGTAREQVMLASRANSASGLVLWVRGNLMITIKGAATARVLFLTYGKALDDKIRSYRAASQPPPLGKPVPTIETPLVVGPDAKVKIGINVSFTNRDSSRAR